MGDEAAKLLLQIMESQIAAHRDLVSQAPNELNNLQSDVRLMEAYLRELGGQLSRGYRSKLCEGDVRDVLYQAEDIFDESLTRTALAKFRKMYRFKRYFDAKHASMAYQVKSFRQSTITPLFQKYGICNISNSLTQQPSPPVTPQLNGKIIAATPSTEGFKGEASTSQSHIIENLINQNIITDIPSIEGNVEGPTGEASTSQIQETPMRRGSVVGFQEKAGEIISFLTREYTELKVMSIIGMPGLGKSTLARKVYDSETLRTHFPNVIWVNFSHKFEKRKVLLSILKSLTNDNLDSRTDDELAETVKIYLMYSKFLLIFDNVWNKEDWEEIETALPKANCLGRVLITSRSESVAATANWRRDLFRLGFLDDNRSWDLLQLQVFDNLNVCPSDLKGLGEEIARRCGGLPLAIVVIAGVLLKKYSTARGVNEAKNEWSRILVSVNKYFSNRRTEDLIALSCNELPLDLRYCFLYLGFFPEESSIPIRRLIGMWIAEGFIWRKENMNMSLEEVAEENLKELIDRNLVMVDKVKPDGYMKTCRVHSLIREFCKNEASFDNRNLFQEMEMSTQERIFSPPVSDIRNRRRICIHSHLETFLGQNPEGPRVHSLLCSAKKAVTLNEAETSLIPQQFKRLRVVDVTPIKLTKFPSKLADLIHLRYIVLSVHADGNDLWALPKEVSRLWNLQSIQIETNSRTFEIKANLWKMVHLRHLKTNAAIILRKKFTGPAGDQLQSVSRLSTQCCTDGVFNKAKNIQNLGICGDLNTILEVQCLRKLENLRKLKLVHDVGPAVASEKRLSGLPLDLFPSNLRILQLSGTFLAWNHILTLENLRALEMLKLKNNAFVGDKWVDHDGCFDSLEILVIAGTDLKIWKAKNGYFPKLKCLELKDCEELQQIPHELTDNLEILHVENISESALESAREIAEKKLELQGQQNGGRGGFRLTIN